MIMGKYLLALFAASVLVIGKSQSQAPKLHVEILYESLCPDSLKFITEQLHPVWQQVAPYVTLKLTPFGKSASLENGAKFVCQHGPQECKGNRIQSCALNLLPGLQDKHVDYVNCFMREFRKGKIDDGQYGQVCSDRIGLNFDEIARCYSSPDGTKLQLLAEQSTGRIRPKFVPTILYNGIFDQELQNASLEDFRGVVCHLILQAYPQSCQSIP